MLLSIETTHRPATDLGYLLHKNPSRAQSIELSFGEAHVFYPVAREDVCRAVVALDVDPVGLVRGRGERSLDQYVNDRPYAASSFLSVALARLFGTAMSGRCKERPELGERVIPLRAVICPLPCRDGPALLNALFEPLGYVVTPTRHALDEQRPEWGSSPYYTVTLEQPIALRSLLEHLYVLLPVLDNDKHYFVGDDEVEKLLKRGGAWLAAHPARELIARRYLKHQAHLTRDALARLAEADLDPDATVHEQDVEEEAVERPLSLNQQRLMAVAGVLKACGAQSVLDLGCGEGNLLRELLPERQFTRIVGVDVSSTALDRAESRLKLDRLPEMVRRKLELLQGSLTYRDDRLTGFDAAAVVEVIEHLDPGRLRSFERAVFEFARPRVVVLTTPNREYNVRWESLPAGTMRHRDHRFEWTRAELRAWAERVASAFGYAIRFMPVGPEDPEVGPPTQMGVFER